MTILPDGSSSGGATPVPPCKRKKLSLKYHNNNQRDPGESTSTMDTMAGITAFYQPIAKPYVKYEVDQNRSSGTDESPASEGTNSSDRGPQIMATLSNMGNTCFLNSVLYTLRFVPHFLHQLHHTILELSSLRPASPNSLTRPQRTQLAMERLHELFQALRGIEEAKDSHMEAIQPSVFFTAFREVNSIFETHQQHDAHELLVALLDNLRDTCLQLKDARDQKQQQPEASFSSEPEQKAKGRLWGKSGIKKRKNKTKYDIKEEPRTSVTPPPPVNLSDPNFITKDFEGTSVLRTTCLECETATERKEAFCDICVPIEIPEPDEGDPPLTAGQVFHEVLLKSEHISGANKYWCEECHHYTEARRSIKYESVPQILTLQLKRFSSSSMFSVSKVNDFMPTPLILECFCEQCKESDDEKFQIKQEEGSQINGIADKHAYHLFAVIMHLGATIASGHYVSFVKASDNIPDYCNCETHMANLQTASTTTASTSSNSGKILKFLKPIKTEKSNHSSLGANVCKGADCCGIRLSLEQGTDKSIPDSSWLECDDDTVCVMTKSEFEDILSEKKSKSSSLTPYLLFYARSP